ncbi:LPXTG cell wall anchor domain-containing protein [bacterium]|nr:LPXTG cell wall anchor domain-containing protein [bacterium]NUN45815.1 LPXTG cell wall anchor domain-containing protein [bacterium]
MNLDTILFFIVVVGLLSFTFLIYIGRKRKKSIGARKERIKNQWRNRLEE